MAEYCKGDQPAPGSYVNIHPSNDVKPIPEGHVDNHVFKGDELASVGNNCKDIVLQIKSDMDKLSMEPSNPCIYRIPNALRETNEKAYTPVMVAIGPYHAKNVALKPMEEHKLRYLKALVGQSRRTDETSKLNEYFEAIARLEPAARRCYDGIINLSENSFTKMLLIDGAFIIEFFYRRLELCFISNDPILAGKAQLEVRRDLILLENQIPYFILERLFELTPKPECTNISLGMLVFICLRYRIPITGIENLGLEEGQRRVESSGGQVLHLVHLIRLFCFSPSPQQYVCKKPNSEPSSGQPFQQPLTATELHESGIHFKQQASGWPSLEIKFAKGIVEMPCIQVYDNTEVFFRNVMAFEQYHLRQYDVTNYMALLDGLMDTTKDVEVLEKSKVIIPRLESRDNVTALFNSITHQIASDPWQYYELCKQLNEHAEKPWNKWKATLCRDYFGSPWTIISLVAAIILLILTVVQTIASVRSTKW